VSRGGLGPPDVCSIQTYATKKSQNVLLLSKIALYLQKIFKMFFDMLEAVKLLDDM
jgi:hypothetical protein